MRLFKAKGDEEKADQEQNKNRMLRYKLENVNLENRINYANERKRNAELRRLQA
jgi:hypothetical protein